MSGGRFFQDIHNLSLGNELVRDFFLRFHVKNFQHHYVAAAEKKRG